MEQYYSLRYVAKSLGVCILTLKRWIYSGKLNATKVGNQWRIKESEINRLTGDK